METKGRIKAISQPTAETYRDGSVHNSIYVQIQIGVKQQLVYDRYTGQQVTEDVPDMIGHKFIDQKAQDFVAQGWHVGDVVMVDYRHGVRNNFCYVVIDGLTIVQKAPQPTQGYLGQQIEQQPVVAQMPAPQPSQAPVAGPVDDLPF